MERSNTWCGKKSEAKKFKVEYMKATWKRYYSRGTRLQDSEVIVRPFFDLSQGRITEMIYTHHAGKAEGWYRVDEFESTMEQLAREVFKKSWTLKNHVHFFKQSSHRLRNASEDCATTGNKKNKERLTKCYEELVDSYSQFDIFIWFPWGITFFLENWCVEKLRQRYDEWEEIYETIARTDTPITLQRMIEEVWQWNIDGEKPQVLQRIVDQYAFLSGYSVNVPFWTAENILELASPLDNCDKQLKEKKQERKVNSETFQRIYQRVAQDDILLAKVIEVIHEYIWLRTERVDEYKRAMMVSQPFYRYVEQLNDWENGWAAYLSIEEMTNLLNNSSTVSKEDLRKRVTNDPVIHITKEKTIVISDLNVQKRFIEDHLGSIDTKNSEVQGRTAFPGKVTGRARVLFHAKHVGTFQKGEILVANMTHPDYLPAIRKASAIVTDEGGIVCHAAVISRELEVPCVIGTGNATRLIKTGDQIEVDAIKGVVKVL